MTIIAVISGGGRRGLHDVRLARGGRAVVRRRGLFPGCAGDVPGRHLRRPARLLGRRHSLQAPEAYFKGANGERLSLEDFRGRVVLLNIWATWCGPCRAEMPSLDRLQALHGADGLEVDCRLRRPRRRQHGERLLPKSGIRNLKLYVDSDRATMSAFRPDGIPMSVLIDREGNVVGEMTGAAKWDSAEATELVQRYLGGVSAAANLTCHIRFSTTQVSTIAAKHCHPGNLAQRDCGGPMNTGRRRHELLRFVFLGPG